MSAKPSHKQIACFECDLLLDYPIINHTETAYCPRCGHLLTIKSRSSLQFSLAFAVSAVFLLFVSNIFPFLVIEAQGRRQEMSLWQSAMMLSQQGSELLAFLVLAFIMVIPALMILALIYLLLPMIFFRKLMPGAIWLSRWLFKLEPWAMVEVFLIGVFASLTKIATLAQIHLGVSFWAYIAFAITLLASMSNLDKYRYWHYLAKVKQCHHH